MDRIRIGLVDDHTLFREGIKSLLGTMPALTLMFDVTDDEQLFTELSNGLPDVILLDLELEKTDGIEITKRLKREYPAIKLIILTMHKEERMISYLMEIGANAYLLKDTGKEELEEAISRVFTEGVYINSLVSAVILKELKEKKGSIPSIGNNYELTEREMSILILIAEELTTAEIADRLCLSVRTIEGYRKNLLSKLGVRNSAGLVLKAVRENIISG